MHDILNATQAAKVIGCRWGEVVEKGKAGMAFCKGHTG